MPVVIHEFEVIADAPPAANGPDAAPAPPAQAPLSPREVERVLERHIERAGRVWAS